MSAAQGCTRSHPHEQMDKSCELRTEIARLTNQNASLKAANAELAEALQLMWDSSCTNAASRPSKAAFLAARAAITKHQKETT